MVHLIVGGWMILSSLAFLAMWGCGPLRLWQWLVLLTVVFGGAIGAGMVYVWLEGRK